MSELKKSPFLEKILKDAELVGPASSRLITVEKVLVVMIDRISAIDDSQSTGEQHITRRLLERMFDDLVIAKKMLLDYIHNEGNQNIAADALFFRKRMREAEALAESAHASDVDALALLLNLRDTPSQTVSAAMGKTECCPENTDDLFDDEDSLPPPFGDEDEDLVFTHFEEPVASPKGGLASLVEETKRIRNELRSAVFGQDNAINLFTGGHFQMKLLELTEPERKRPRAIYLFAGPPGVGKTFLAEKIAESLQLPFKRFDMSEYSDDEAVIEFCGSDKVYKNGKMGNVTSFAADNPRSVLLFDEIEKAHLTVIHLFLQMLDAGRLRDNYTDKVVSFTDTIIILTTNAGRQLYEDSTSLDLSGIPKKVIMQALETDKRPGTDVPFFPAAICSRMAAGNVVMFNHLGAHHLHAIACREIQRNAAGLEKQTDLQVHVDEQVYTALMFAEGGNADARTVRGRAEIFYNHELFELLRLISSGQVQTGLEDIENICIDVDLEQASREIRNLFIPAGRATALVFAQSQDVQLCMDTMPEIDFLGVQTTEQALAVMKEREVDFVLLDMLTGAAAGEKSKLNLEDLVSPAREFLKFLRQRREDMPVYLLEQPQRKLSDEEQISFLRQGIRGVLPIGEDKAAFGKSLAAVATSLHQQAGIVKLSKENKVVTFGTEQTITEDGKQANIRLFDFALTTAVTAEDAKSIVSANTRPTERFADVIGAKDAKKELAYFVSYLRDPKKYIGTGVKAPKGVILYGPPGTGKTMLAKAMACEAGVTFLSAQGNQFLKQRVGEGSEAVHKLFRTARKYAPAILFIDEIDAIAKERKGYGNAEETLTAFLTEMDGFDTDPSRPVFVLAATNFDVEPGSAKSLDPALMRRFDRRVYMDLPDKEDRIRFLNKKISGNRALEISPDMVENIAIRSTGMSLAQMDSVIELALRSAIREGKTSVSDAILEEALEIFNGGDTKKWDISQLERVARHESGHALLCWLSGEKPSYLTVVARGDHGGYMQREIQEGKHLFTKEELLGRIRTSLGGRAAELVYYGEQGGLSTGAGGDLRSATATARRIVSSYGMDEDFGLAAEAQAEGPMTPEVRSAVNRILKEQMQQAIRLVAENKSTIDALVEALMAKNHLSGKQIAQIMTEGTLTEEE